MKYIILIIIASSSVVSFAQNSFPNLWMGEYEGQMIITFVDRPNDTIDVGFVMEELEKDSIWTYTMSYHSEKWGDIVKDYRYIAKKKGEYTHFIFDELNGIKMEMTLMNDCFYGMYDVMDVIYVSTLCKVEEGLHFELFGAPSKEPFVSSTQPDEEGKTIEAESMKPNLVQFAILKRK